MLTEKPEVGLPVLSWLLGFVWVAIPPVVAKKAPLPNLYLVWA
jgi:hypothetical protein